MRSVCVFSGSRMGARLAYRAAAEDLADELLRRGLRLVYGGGDIGLMGVMADRLIAAGGEVIGVIPRFLVEREVAHRGITQLHVVQSMHERKALMADLSDAFLALPGGFGTLEELFEVVTWRQLHLHAKPCGLLNCCGYFDQLLQFLERCTADDFLRREHLDRLLVDEAPGRLLDRLTAESTAASPAPLPAPDVR
jgi:uncharacterized protein (TIGR00730 family)